MLIVGLTGGIASGKSLVSRIFRDLGASLIDADRIVHELLAPGQEAGKEVAEHFGRGILLPDGSIDRRKLGEIVFNDQEQRAWLNACLHPRVFQVYTAKVKRLGRAAPDAIVVFDAALLIETGFHRKMDRTVVVYADRDQQVRRLGERDRLTPQQADVRIDSQMPLAEKLALADYVIDNRGTREETEQSAREVFAKLREEAREAGR